MEMPKIVVFVVKRYTACEAIKWRYAERKAKIGRYAVHKRGKGCHPLYLYNKIMTRMLVKVKTFYCQTKTEVFVLEMSD